MSGTTLNVPVTVTGLHGRPLSSGTPVAGNGILFDGTTWQYEGVIPTTPNAPAAGDVLVYDGSNWNPAELAARNFIDNSGFTVNQRGYTSGTALAANAYGFDRWKAGGSGCTLTFTATPASTIVTIGSGSIQQVVEGAALLTGNYTLSWAGTAVCSVGALTNVASPVQVGAAAGSDLIITFSGGTLGQVQLQIGTVATPWQPQPAAIEQERCERFYQALSAPNSIGGWAGANGAFIFNTPFTFRTTMRAAPTIVTQLANASGISAISVQAISPTALSLNATASAAPSWWGANMSYTASADL